MVQQKKDLFSQIGNDVLKALANRLVPKRTKRGRPKKVAWEDRLANIIISSKIVLPMLSAWVLFNRSVITSEQMAMIVHYVTANQNSIPITELYPTSPNWVVRKALKEFGLNVNEVSVTWNEIMDLIGQLYQIYLTTQQQAGQPPKIEEVVKNFGTMPGFEKTFAGLSFMGMTSKPTEDAKKSVNKIRRDRPLV